MMDVTSDLHTHTKTKNVFPSFDGTSQCLKIIYMIYISSIINTKKTQIYPDVEIKLLTLKLNDLYCGDQLYVLIR